MRTSLETYTVSQICEEFGYDEFGGKALMRLSENLTIQPEYQRVKPKGICCG